MTSVIKAAKSVVLATAGRVGVFDLIRDSKWRAQRLLILCYHGIAIDDEDQWDPCLYISQRLFRERLAILQRGGYSVLSLEEGISRLYKGDLPPRAVTITFDDGVSDFHSRACPVLAEFGFPATVYLTTYYATHRYPVFNVFFSYLLWKGQGPGKRVELSEILPGQSQMPLETDEQRGAVLARIQSHVHQEKFTNEEKACLARKLAAQFHIDYDERCQRGILHIMSRDEVADLQPRNISVQLHTHRHRTPDDEALFRREIRENREHIQSMFPKGDPVKHFCYPSGRYKPEFFPWLQAENVATATTCQPGLASRTSPPLTLPRLIDTSSVTSLEFEGWLSGTSDWLPRRS